VEEKRGGEGENGGLRSMTDTDGNDGNDGNDGED